MRKILLTFVAALCCVTMFATEGALSGGFSINAKGDKVQFSKGNLQYKPSTQTWRFAEKQNDQCGTYYNQYVAADYDEFIDLFGWGTGANPVEVGLIDEYAHINPYSNFTDWGTNAISNGGNEANLWRTLTKTEWLYILVGRKNANKLFTLGYVDNVEGLILLPDDWITPRMKYRTWDLKYVAAGENGITFDGTRYYNDTFGNGYQANNLTEEEWEELEKAGAVFLPWTPMRTPLGEGFVDVQTHTVGTQYTAYYWTSSASSDVYAYSLNIGPFEINPQLERAKFYGYAVRLVQPYEADPEPEPIVKELSGRFSVAADKQITFAQGNLQCKAVGYEFKFANNQYDMCGEANSNTSAGYRGWFDLYGYATTGTGIFDDAYYPWETSTYTARYSTYNLEGTSIVGSKYDWFTTNKDQIVNAGDKDWRLVSADEWDYLLNSRPNSASKQGQAVVNDVKGYILLPDNWTCPAGISFSAIPNNYTTNIYTLDQWTQMEDAGAVFLPAAGNRYGTDVNAIEAGNGYYWTGDLAEDENMAKAVTFTAYTRLNIFSGMYPMGYSIRPARYVDTQGIDQITNDQSQMANKVIRNGMLLIEKNGKLYNALGTEVK